MIPQSTKKTLSIIVIALCVTLALYWGYRVYQERALRATIVTLVKDTSVRFRDALAIEASPARGPEIAAKLQANFTAVDQHLADLRRIDSPRPELEPATDYVVTCREILLRQSTSHASRLALAQSVQALRDHMPADRRSPDWAEGAVRAKERVDKAYRDFRIATDSYLSLLGTFPESQAKVHTQVKDVLVIEGSLINEARSSASETAKKTADEVTRLTQLDRYR